MRKSVEMRKQLDSLKNEISTLQAEGKIQEAHAKLTDLANQKAAIEVQEVLEKDEDEGFGKIAKPLDSVHDIANPDKVANRAFNKALMGKALTEEEMKFMPQVLDAAGTPGQVGATPARGGYLLREEQVNTLKELRRSLVALKDYCNVVPVNTRAGAMPLLVDDTSALINFDELTEINQSDVTFGAVAYNIADYGDIIPVSRTLTADTDFNLVSIIGARFAKKAVRAENAKVLAQLQALTPAKIKDYAEIKTVINTGLDPDLLEGTVILTNQDGFDYLDQVILENGQPLLQPVLGEATRKRFAGHEIVVLSNAQLPTTDKKVPFFVGNMTEFVAFFDREQVAVDLSEHAGFTKNADLIRAIERFDVKTVDTAAMKYLQLELEVV